MMNIQTNISKKITIFLIITVFLYILSSSVAVPLLFKQFYYLQIDNLHIEKDTGYSREEIETAYSEVVDYCIGIKKEFSAGNFKYSEEGKNHFADCRKLFILDLIVMIITILILLGWILLRKKLSINYYRPKNHGAGYWGAIILIISFTFLVGIGSIDFNKTFSIFHSIFFPGKSNWIFDPEIDEIIEILPETFFMRCAILIVGFIFLQSLFFIVSDLIQHKKLKTKDKKDII